MRILNTLPVRAKTLCIALIFKAFEHPTFQGVLGNFNRTGRKHLKMFSVYNEFVLFLMNKSMF